MSLRALCAFAALLAASCGGCRGHGTRCQSASDCAPPLVCVQGVCDDAPGDAPDGGTSESFELLVVPGLAFDRQGYRLGRGGGYYDRFLARRVASTVVGLAFSWQIVPEVPRDPWDVPVGAIVTERGVIRVAPPGGAIRV